ncbi:sigma-54-dependent transcriptional regulator [Aestuariivirga litoralis]|uniref:sigma-54-dependent transcriptional regulator n=1 Tax=Aestuariivirga litoralis TaxID=2650924 RepID=UPI0018C834EA|nr:sigma-54 dependent transcriptional regulator [Aestuariivirga litoralis]MBG1233312.1 sigma-54-dependent Fis family transcriptional regulator [Aestuariivirga litoralis]
MSNRVLIVEDEPAQRRILEEMIKRFGFEVVSADNGHKALEALSGSLGSSINLIILDLVMPGMDGLEFLEKLEAVRGDLPVIVQTSQGSIETVIKAMRAGADDFVVKPVAPERLRVSIQNLLKVNALTEEVKRLNKKVSGALTFDDLVASSPAMNNVLRLGRRGAQSNIPILIEGESGVGKEMIARAIQGESDRAGKPFVAVNCGAIPQNLVESILFGHEKGSFTGATGKHLGKFAEADGGTLFLDEVAELPLDIQVKLLRAIQEGEIDAVGSRKPTKVNIRLISATNKNMIEMVKAGQFREDLYYRLNVYPVMVPALRDRKDDIPALVNHFITKLSAEEGRKVHGITSQALAMLQLYAWPGNVRQIENTIFRAIVLCETEVLDVADFPQIAALVEGYEVKIPAAPAAVKKPELVRPANGQVSDGNAIGVSIVTEGGHIRTLEEVEADMIKLAMHRYRGQMSEVARKLGIGRSTLYRKMRDLGLEEAASV